MPDNPIVKPIFVGALVDALEHNRLFGLNGDYHLCGSAVFCGLIICPRGAQFGM